MDFTKCSPRRWTGYCVTWCIDNYLTIASRRPCTVISAWLVGALVFIWCGFAIGGIPEIETDFSMRSDGIVADRNHALMRALDAESERRSRLDDARRLGASSNNPILAEVEVEADTRQLAKKQEERSQTAWHINIFYEAVEGDIFNPGVLDDIRAFETRIASLPSYKDYCLMSRIHKGQCRWARSFMRFLYGFRESVITDPRITAYRVVPNGSQMEPNDAAAVRDAMAEKKKWTSLEEPVGRLWYFDNNFPDSRSMRSTFPFGKPLHGFSHTSIKKQEQEALFVEWIDKELYPVLRDASTERVRIYYDGSIVLWEYEFKLLVTQDALKAIASLFLVYVYMAMYTRAPLIALFGMTTMVLSIPMGMVLFRLTGHPTMPALNFLALFLLTGIGADNLFVLIDCWRHTKRDFMNLKSRLRLTFARAGKSLTACGTTTAVSFVANVFSSVRPLRWFGIFVGLCVISNVILCLAMFPPLLLLRERTKRRKVVVQEKETDAESGSSKDAVVQSPPRPFVNDVAKTPINVPNSHWLSEEALAAAGQRESGQNVPQDDDVRGKGCCWHLALRRRHPDAFDVSAFANIGWEQAPVKMRRLKRGEHYYSELYAPEDEIGRKVPFNWAESFFGDVYAPVLQRSSLLIVFLFFAVTILNCILVGVNMEPSRESPVLFAPGSHNLGDVALKREEFGNAPWSSQMETEPLLTCEGCQWDQNCTWGLWSDWVACNKSWCNGRPVRSRHVAVPRGPGGDNCTGSGWELCFGDPSCPKLFSPSIGAPLEAIDATGTTTLTTTITSTPTTTNTSTSTTTTTTTSTSTTTFIGTARKTSSTTVAAASASTTFGTISSTEASSAGGATATAAEDTSSTSQAAEPPANSTIPLQPTHNVVSASARRRKPSRGLPPGINAKLADKEIAAIDVVFGLKVNSDHAAEGVEYDMDFNIEDSSTQLLLSRICHDIEEQGNLLAVRRQKCIIESFKEYLHEKDVPYPISSDHSLGIHDEVDLYIAGMRRRKDRNAMKRQLGYVDGRIRWIKLEILSNLPDRLPAVDAWQWALRWDEYIDKLNENSRKNQLPQCFHTSWLWVRADAERQLVDSTIMCAIASVMFASAVVLWFLGDLVLAMILMCSVVGIILALASLMFTVYAWPFGAIEAVSLIIVVGFSVDYALHIAESYHQSTLDTRYLRVQDALRRTGGALLGAAATSVLACPPILFCTIQVFVQFGLTLIANMLLALVFSLFFFAAALIAFGPMPGDCDRLKHVFSPRTSRTPVTSITQAGHEVNQRGPASDDDLDMPPRSDPFHEEKLSSEGSIGDRSNTVSQHLSRPSVVKALTRTTSSKRLDTAAHGIGPIALEKALTFARSEHAPHVIGHVAWEKAEQPEGPHRWSAPGAFNFTSPRSIC